MVLSFDNRNVTSISTMELLFFLSLLEINATGFNYQNEDEKVTLSFPSVLQKGKSEGGEWVAGGGVYTANLFTQKQLYQY